MSQAWIAAVDLCLYSDPNLGFLTRMHISACFWGLLSLSLTSIRASSIDSSHGVYSGSQTPNEFPWNTYVDFIQTEASKPHPSNSYNYCNAPHVNAARYSVPTNASGAKLVYMNVMIRHHKVTNLIPLSFPRHC